MNDMPTAIVGNEAGAGRPIEIHIAPPDIKRTAAER